MAWDILHKKFISCLAQHIASNVTDTDNNISKPKTLGLLTGKKNTNTNGEMSLFFVHFDKFSLKDPKVKSWINIHLLPKVKHKII